MPPPYTRSQPPRHTTSQLSPTRSYRLHSSTRTPTAPRACRRKCASETSCIVKLYLSLEVAERHLEDAADKRVATVLQALGLGGQGLADLADGEHVGRLDVIPFLLGEGVHTRQDEDVCQKRDPSPGFRSSPIPAHPCAEHKSTTRSPAHQAQWCALTSCGFPSSSFRASCFCRQPWCLLCTGWRRSVGASPRDQPEHNGERAPSRW